MAGTIDRRPVAPPNDRRARDAVVVLGIAIILLFALVGVVSAGIFLGGRVTAKSSSTPTPRASTGSALAAQDLARARAQATQIVRVAQDSGNAIVKRRTARARRQAAAIISAAKRQAATVSSSAAASGSTRAPQQASGLGAASSGSATSSGTSGYGSTSPTTAAGSPPSATINLSGMPSTWLVVAYNASFGTGPGSAGGITVTNRSSKRLSGTARVVYTRGGSASAGFSGLAPGQTLILPLNGPAYSSGGYTIRVVVPH